MQPHSGRGKKWRRFRHKYRFAFYMSLLMLVVIALVGGLMYLLTTTRPQS